MKLFLIPLSIVVLCSCATKSIPEATKTEMDSDIKRYLNYRNQKAYAVAVEKDGAWVSGWRSTSLMLGTLTGRAAATPSGPCG